MSYQGKGFHHPSYADRAHNILSDPAYQGIRGCLQTARGYPNLNKIKDPYYTPSFRIVRTLKAGK